MKSHKRKMNNNMYVHDIGSSRTKLHNIDSNKKI